MEDAAIIQQAENDYIKRAIRNVKNVIKIQS